MEGRHPLLLGRDLRRCRPPGAVQRQRRAFGYGRKTHSRGSQRLRPLRCHGRRDTLFRRDPSRNRRARPRVHGGGQARIEGRRGREEIGMLRFFIPRGLFRLQRLRVEDVRSDGAPSAMRILVPRGRQSMGADSPQGRVPEASVGSDGAPRRPHASARRIRARAHSTYTATLSPVPCF